MNVPSSLRSDRVSADIVFGRRRVENKVETFGVLLDLGGICREHHFVRAQSLARYPATLFAEVVKSTVCAPKAFANFTPMCPDPETDHANLLSRADFPVAHRRIDGDAGTQKGAAPARCRGRDVEDERFVHHDALGITAASDAAQFTSGEL